MAKIVGETQQETKKEEKKEKTAAPKIKKGKKRFEKRQKETKAKESTPVVPSVKPEVEYQEKTSVTIKPSHHPVSLSTPIKDTEDFAEKDNSVDGFLSIKH